MRGTIHMCTNNPYANKILSICAQNNTCAHKAINVREAINKHKAINFRETMEIRMRETIHTHKAINIRGTQKTINMRGTIHTHKTIRGRKQSIYAKANPHTQSKRTNMRGTIDIRTKQSICEEQ